MTAELTTFHRQRRHRERRQLTHFMTNAKVVELECALAAAVQREQMARDESLGLRRRVVELEARVETQT